MLSTLVLLAAAALPQSATAQDCDLVIFTEKPPDRDNPAVATKYGLTRDDYQWVAGKAPGVESAVPIRSRRVEARAGERTLDVDIIGTTPHYADARGLKVTRGRFLLEKDVRRLNNVVAVDETVARSLFGERSPIGESIRVGGHYHLIVGVVSSTGKNALRYLDADPEGLPQIYIPFSTMRSRMGDLVVVLEGGALHAERYELSAIAVSLKDGEDAEQRALEISRGLSRVRDTKEFSIQIIDARRRLD